MDSGPFRRFEETALAVKPRLAVVLGSGLNSVALQLRPICSLPFHHVPGLRDPSAEGHEGRLTIGEWMGKKILVQEGRLHFYEGHSWEAVCRPIQVIHSLGVKFLIATNAAGGIHPNLAPGSLMLIRDHLHWTRPHCKFANNAASRPSFYSPRLMSLFQHAATSCGMTLRSGCYAAVLGPNYETPAEIRALTQCGANAVGMSTVREIQCAGELGLECAAISCITNRAAGLADGAVITHREVLETATATCEQLAELIEAFIEVADL